MNKFYSIFIIGLLFSPVNVFCSYDIKWLVYSGMKEYFACQVSQNIKNKINPEIYIIPTLQNFETSYGGHVVDLTKIAYLTPCLNAIMDLRKENLVGPREGLSDLGALSVELEGSVWGNSENVPKNLILKKTHQLQEGNFVLNEKIIFTLRKRWYLNI